MVNAVNGQSSSPRRRAYDASGRRAAAEEARGRILGSARELFLAKGYGATTIAQIARKAKVSPETVYKNFGGKPGLVRAIQEQSLLGAGGPPAEERSDLAQLTEADPRKLMERLGRFTAEISPLGAPIILLIRDAAATGHAEMAELLREVDDARYQRMLHNAHQMVGRGLHPPRLSAEEAADVMFTCTTAEIYESLVIRRGWKAEQYGRFIARTLVANLLE